MNTTRSPASDRRDHQVATSASGTSRAATSSLRAANAATTSLVWRVVPISEPRARTRPV